MKKDTKKDYLDDFLGNEEEVKDSERTIKTDHSLVEVVNKKILTEDGRQLLT